MLNETPYSVNTFESLTFLYFLFQLENGCVSQTVNTKVFQLHRSGLYMSFLITVTATETGTGNGHVLWAVWGHMQLTGEKFIELAVLTNYRSIIVHHSSDITIHFYLLYDTFQIW